MTEARSQSADALALWREKLASFERQRAIVADAPSKFELDKNIEECKAKIAELEQVPHTASGLPSLPHIEAAPPWNVPMPPNPFFTGRERALDDIEKEFKNHRAVALCGLGGVGKTQTAARYAHQHRDGFKAVLWVSAASREALISGFAALAGKDLLNLPERSAQDQAQAVAAVKRWLEGNEGWLLILDTSNELALVRELGLQPDRGRMLLTTQTQALGGLARKMEILEMEPGEGALFLLRRAGLLGEDEPLEAAKEPDRELAQQLSGEMGGLPLALDQAGAYIEETECPLAKYLGLYKGQGAELRKRRGGLAPGGAQDAARRAEHHDSVAATFALSFENVKNASEPAAEILRLCAFLDPDAIPEEILTAGAEELGPLLAPVCADSLKLDEAVGAARRYSLLDRSDGTLSVHRLVQDVIQDGLADDEKRQRAERAVRAVEAAFRRARYWLCVPP